MLDDLFSSSKGPGLIGLLLGLVVLAGFGGLGLAVFDGRFNGDFSNRQQKDIARQQEEINSLKERKASYEEKLNRKRELKKVISASEAAQRELKQRVAMQVDLQKKHTDLSATVQNALEDWENYKEDYRATARDRMIGKKFDEIKTADGAIFKGATITRITALELTLRTSEAIKNVKLADMPLSIRDELQFDQEMAEILADEIAERKAARAKDLKAASRLQKLQYQVRQTELAIERNGQSLENNLIKKVTNERSANELRERAKDDWEEYREDKLAGRSSRADDRAQDKERRAEALLSQNRALDRKNDGLTSEIRQFKSDIASAKREMARLEREAEQDTVAEQP